jgi:hypothetical protein
VTALIVEAFNALADTIDGAGPDRAAQHRTHQQLLELAAQTPVVYLPTHEWESERRLEQREPVPVEALKRQMT